MNETPDFSKLLGDTQAQGAKVFARKFGGFWHNKKRAEKEALELVINMELASTPEEAKQILDSLEGKEIRYSKDKVEGDYFTLKSSFTPKGEKIYYLYMACNRI